MSIRSGLPRRVLAVGAHPDDIELGCAGTLGRFVEVGSAVVLAVATRGDRGGPAAAAEETAARRRAEAEAAAALLGAPIEFLGFGDATLANTPAIRGAFVALLRRARPELVLTHGPDDYHADHVAVSRLVTAAAWFAASPGHEGDDPPLDAPPAVAYMDNLAGIGPDPTHLVDIGGTFDLKRRMLACHASQLARPDAGFPDLAELSQTLARLRGIQCGVRFAEGFRPALLWGRRRPEPLFP